MNVMIKVTVLINRSKSRITVTWQFEQAQNIIVIM
jgi:hypothetical protein